MTCKWSIPLSLPASMKSNFICPMRNRGSIVRVKLCPNPIWHFTHLIYELVNTIKTEIYWTVLCHLVIFALHIRIRFRFGTPRTAYIWNRVVHKSQAIALLGQVKMVLSLVRHGSPDVACPCLPRANETTITIDRMNNLWIKKLPRSKRRSLRYSVNK